MNKDYLIGKAFGLLEAISTRPDMPPDIKDACKEEVESYDRARTVWEEVESES